MSEEPRIVTATAEMSAGVREVLLAAGLPSADVAVESGNFVVAIEGDTIVGTIGLEPCGGWGLLRSLAVAPERRTAGIGRRLCERVFARAGELQLQGLYLLTTTADGYFQRLGFELVERSQVPEEIRQTAEFTSICPASARVFRRGVGPRTAM
jgi:amino-acid N-acetyltransferase